VARRQLALTESDYRSILSLYGGVERTAELDGRGFTALMARFEQLGFRSTSARRPLPARLGMASPAQSSLIRQLWAEATDNEGTEASLGKWLETKFKVSSMRFVTAEAAPKVIGGLRAMKVKRKARTAA
jgi:hypothetical protein